MRSEQSSKNLLFTLKSLHCKQSQFKIFQLVTEHRLVQCLYYRQQLNVESQIKRKTNSIDLILLSNFCLSSVISTRQKVQILRKVYENFSTTKKKLNQILRIKIYRKKYSRFRIIKKQTCFHKKCLHFLELYSVNLKLDLLKKLKILKI